MATPDVLDTGYVNVVTGQTTQITVPHGKILSARVRWRGKKRDVVTDTSTTAHASGDGGNSVFTGALTPSNPGGTLQKVTAEVNFETAFSGTWVCAARAGGVVVGGVVVQNEGTGTSGSAYAEALLPLEAVGSASIETQRTLSSWHAVVTAFWREIMEFPTVNPRITVNGQTTQYTGTLNQGETTSWIAASGFVAGQINDVLHTIETSGYAEVRIEITYTSALEVQLREPGVFARATRPTLVFRARVVRPTSNEATVYHLRVTAARVEDLTPPDFTWNSQAGQADWEYTLDDGDTWIPLGSGGAPIGATVRYTPPVDEMELGRWYWTAEAWDDDTEAWSAPAAIRQFRLALTLTFRVLLNIGGVDYTQQTLNIRVTETTNGEMGSIEFDLIVPPGADMPADGEVVLLGVRDAAGYEEQYEGWLQGAPALKEPSLFSCIVKLPDAILTERCILEDYPSQDVGLTFAEIIDDYCAPLNSAGINTSTGFERPVTAFGRMPLDIAQELQEQYDLRFWVRSTDGVVFLVLPEDIGVPSLTVTRGQGV